MRLIILYLVKRFLEEVGREVTLTRLVKLLYLTDLRLRERGLPGLGVRWIRWYYGPFSKEIVSAVEALTAERKLREEFIPTGAGVIRVFRPRRGLKVEVEPAAAEVVDEVVREYGAMNFDDLLREVYSTFSSREVDLGEEIPL